MKKIIILIPILIIIFIAFSFISLFFLTGRNQTAVQINIEDGMSSKKIIGELRARDAIRSKLAFKICLNLLNANTKIKTGVYVIKSHETNLSIIQEITSSTASTSGLMKVTFPEGFSIYKIAKLLSEKTNGSYFKDFYGLTDTNAQEIFKGYPFSKYADDKSLEGFLFPDTYNIDPSTTTDELAKKMVKRFNDVIWHYWISDKASSILEFYDTLILASIIEKEAKLDSDRPIIASVFYNRLRMKMPLASCVTVKYALEKPTKHVYINQLNINSPYNTYKRRGLPPTPICNPGLKSFIAAVHPAETDYIYFVAKKDGGHIFSSSWAEHQKARVSAKNIPTVKPKK